MRTKQSATKGGVITVVTPSTTPPPNRSSRNPSSSDTEYATPGAHSSSAYSSPATSPPRRRHTFTPPLSGSKRPAAQADTLDDAAGKQSVVDSLLSALSDAESMTLTEHAMPRVDIDGALTNIRPASNEPASAHSQLHSTWDNPLAAEVNAVAPAAEGHSASRGSASLMEMQGSPSVMADCAAVAPKLRVPAVLPSLMGTDSEIVIRDEIQPQVPRASTPKLGNERMTAASILHAQAQARQSAAVRGLPQPSRGVRARPSTVAVVSSQQASPPGGVAAAPRARSADNDRIEALQQQNAALVHRLEIMEEALRQTQSQMSMMSSSFFGAHGANSAAMAPPATHGSVLGGGGSSMMPAGAACVPPPMHGSMMHSSGLVNASGSFARSASLSEQNERAAALHSKQVKWPEGPGRSRRGKAFRRDSTKPGERSRSLPAIATGRGDTHAQGGKAKKERKSEKRAEKKSVKSPNSSRASTNADQSLNVESLSQGSTNGGSVAAGPLEARSETPLGALVEGGSSAAVAQAALVSNASGSPRDGARSDAVPRASSDSAGERSAASNKKGWLSMLRPLKGNAAAEEPIKDGLGRDRQVVHLLGAGDLTRGKGEKFGVSAAKGNETLLQQDEARRAAAVLKARKRVEAERGGLFRKGNIAEHAPVGKRKFGFGLSCF